MKTGITIIDPKQVSMDEWRDFRITKVFDDTATIGDIKKFISRNGKLSLDKVGLSGVDISDIIED